MEIINDLKGFISKFSMDFVRLGNTVPLQVFKNPYSPSMSMIFCVNDGVAYEPENLWGISHFVEHILLRGTDKYPTLYDIARRVEGVGGKISAYSTRNMVSFWIKVLPGYEHVALDVMEEILVHPLLKEEYIESERLIIQQERHRELNNPAFYSSIALEGLLLLPDPLSRHPVGDDEVIKNMGEDLLRGYIQKNYNKQNLGIALSGNISENYLELFEDTISRFPDGSPPERADFKISSEVSEKEVIILPSHHKSQIYLSIGWKFPLEDFENMFTWRIINTLLGAGYTSLLNRILREEKNLTYLCTTKFSTYEDSGIFKINLALSDKNLGKALEVIDSLIDELKEEKINREIFQEAIVRHLSFVVTRIEDSLEVAKAMGQFLLRDDKDFSFLEYLEKIEKVDLSSAAKLAKKHLIDKNRKILLHTGSEAVMNDYPHALKLPRSKDGAVIIK